ncbi:MAG: threonyl-tRNA synthetase editing domain-containing protein [Methanosarcinales archaeon Met12]|nr:MAG: threonyl-tRNA synthetase editing domain-containing protein [Methanosarcinales archaeon Met12]
MRLQFKHCDYIKWKVKKKAKSSIIEELGSNNEGYVDEALVVFMASEGLDQKNPQEVSQKAVESIGDVANQIKIKRVVLFPYVHLFPESLPPAEFAFDCIKQIGYILEREGYEAWRVPFGWYKMHELRCKGHPLSELSKTIRCD